MTPTATTSLETPHAFLRRESAVWHMAVEQAFADCDLRSRAGLAAFLTAQARAVFAVENALDRGGAASLWKHWPRRKRGELVRADLRTLGCPLPAPATAPHLETEDRCLGALYVLEGSRLGGKLLARQIRESGDPLLREATRFLDDGSDGNAWARFRAMLDQACTDRTELLQGAERAFACFVGSPNPVPNVNGSVSGGDTGALAGQPST